MSSEITGSSARKIILEVENLRVTRNGSQILNIPLFQIFEGEVLVIVGPNGSGKTTFLQTMSLLLKPDSGFIKVKGHIPNTEKDQLLFRRRFAVVLQESLLFNDNVWHNVLLGLKLRGIPEGERKKRAEKWLARFGALHLANRNASTLSGGEAKRISLARAFALEPEILFLDEPFSGLDTPTYESLLKDFSGVLSETGTTTVLVTHDYNEAVVLGSRIAVLIDGVIRQSGSPSEVFSFPVDQQVAEFLRSGNLIAGTVISQQNGLARIKVKDHELEAVSNLKAGTEVFVYLNYDAITISPHDYDKVLSSARNRLDGVIMNITTSGQLTRVEVDCGFPLVAIITRKSAEELDLKFGKSVVASFKATALHIISRETAGR